MRLYDNWVAMKRASRLWRIIIIIIWRGGRVPSAGEVCIRGDGPPPRTRTHRKIIIRLNIAAAPQQTRRWHCFRSGLVRGRRLARRRRRRRTSGRRGHGPIVLSRRRRSFSVSEPRTVCDVFAASPSGHLLTVPAAVFFFSLFRRFNTRNEIDDNNVLNEYCYCVTGFENRNGRFRNDSPYERKKKKKKRSKNNRKQCRCSPVRYADGRCSSDRRDEPNSLDIVVLPWSRRGTLFF